MIVIQTVSHNPSVVCSDVRSAPSPGPKGTLPPGLQLSVPFPWKSMSICQQHHCTSACTMLPNPYRIWNALAIYKITYMTLISSSWFILVGIYFTYLIMLLINNITVESYEIKSIQNHLFFMSFLLLFLFFVHASLGRWRWEI